jgi:hypothetical protein
MLHKYGDIRRVYPLPADCFNALWLGPELEMTDEDNEQELENDVVSWLLFGTAHMHYVIVKNRDAMFNTSLTRN